MNIDQKWGVVKNYGEDADKIFIKLFDDWRDQAVLLVKRANSCNTSEDRDSILAVLGEMVASKLDQEINVLYDDIKHDPFDPIKELKDITAGLYKK